MLINQSLALPSMDPGAAAVDWHLQMISFGRLTPPYNALPMDPTGSYFVGDSFYTVLHAFLSVPEYNYVFSNYLALNNATGLIELSAIGFTLNFLSSASTQVSALDSWRALASSSPFGANNSAFFSNDNEAFWEQLGFMKDEATRLFSLTLVAVAIVCSLFLVHPLAILVQLLTLGMVFIDLLGALALSGIQINSISVVNMIMAIGLVVDATVHIVRTFGVQDPSLPREKRVTLTLGELGTPILLGAVSLILGVLSLSSSSSAVFKTFFYCFCFMWVSFFVVVEALI